jgi:S1-C subfamily serine protease
MSLLRTSRWIAGIPVLCALLFCAAPDRAAYSKDDSKRTTELFGAVAKEPTESPPRLGVVFPEDENDDAWVTGIDDTGPAAKAGIKPGDTITRFNGAKVKSVKEFRDVIKNQKPGDVVKITVRRAEKKLTLSVTLGQPQP